MALTVPKEIKEWRIYVGEFLGTFTFVFLSLALLVSNLFYTELGILAIALGVGFIYSALIFSTIHIAGGYLNPAVTFSLWLVQRISSLRAILLIFAQVVASFAAAYSLLFLFGKEVLEFNFGVPVLGANVAFSQALVLETILSAIFIFALFATMVDRNGPVSFGPLVLGILLVGETIVAFGVSGAVVNPARVVGALVISKSFDSLIIYSVGPTTGALLGIVYEYLFLKKSIKGR